MNAPILHVHRHGAQELETLKETLKFTTVCNFLLAASLKRRLQWFGTPCSSALWSFSSAQSMLPSVAPLNVTEGISAHLRVKHLREVTDKKYLDHN